MVFWGGAYGSLPDAAIWWCLWTGGGGVVTRSTNPICDTIIEELPCHHGQERLWPLPWPVAWWHPNQAHRRHPHTMDDDSCTWFHRDPSGAQVVVPLPTVVFRDILECARYWWCWHRNINIRLLSFSRLNYYLHISKFNSIFKNQWWPLKIRQSFSTITPTFNRCIRFLESQCS